MQVSRGGIILTMAIFLIISCKQKPADTKLVDKEANAKMKVILDSIAQQNIDKDDPFDGIGQLDFFTTEVNNAGADPNRRSMALFFKAAALLKVGKEKDAVDIYATLANDPHLTGNPVIFNQLQQYFALASLRYGERTNCLDKHMAESCIFPLKGMGMHQDETGSRGAIKIYEQILKAHPDDLESRWLLNIAYMTVNGYPKQVPAAYLIPDLDKDTSGIAIKPFTDIAANLKLDTKNNAGGVITDDFNNDGYLDIITTDWIIGTGKMHYFKNDTKGGFTDVTEQAGLGSLSGGLNIIQADYNNDGYLDLFILRGAWLPGKFGKEPNSLLRNNGDGTFTDVTVQSGLLSFHPTQTAVWKDFNNDGWLDIFIGNETTATADPQPCELYLNNGDGTFKEVATEAGCNLTGFIKGVTSADYNNDGWPDIYISTVSGTRTLLKNDGLTGGKLHFTDVTHQAGLDDIHVKTFTAWFWDYDNDGWPDIFVCGYDPGQRSMAYATAAEALRQTDPGVSTMYLYHNNHNGTFTNVTKQAGLDKTCFTMGANFGDFDNDGYLDMYMATGNPDYKTLVPNRLFKNVDGKKFVDVTLPARVGNLQKGHAVSFVDLDNDGDQDIFTVTGGAYQGDYYYNSFYSNPGQNNNNWVSLQLQGVKCNRSAIGARIKLTFKDGGVTRTIYRDENSGGSFGSSPLRREIGIGQATVIDEVSITWPGSTTPQIFKNVTPNQFYSIKQGSDALQKVNIQKLQFNNKPGDMGGMKM